MPPCKRGTTTNLKTKNQNCQKNELYGSLTTEELKKHSSRLVRGAEMGIQGGEDVHTVAAGGLGLSGSSRRTRWSHICVWINQEEHLGSETDHTTQGSSAGEIKPQNL